MEPDDWASIGIRDNILQIGGKLIDGRTTVLQLIRPAGHFYFVTTERLRHR